MGDTEKIQQSFESFKTALNGLKHVFQSWNGKFTKVKIKTLGITYSVSGDMERLVGIAQDYLSSDNFSFEKKKSTSELLNDIGTPPMKKIAKILLKNGLFLKNLAKRLNRAFPDSKGNLLRLLVDAGIRGEDLELLHKSGLVNDLLGSFAQLHKLLNDENALLFLTGPETLESFIITVNEAIYELRLLPYYKQPQPQMLLDIAKLILPVLGRLSKPVDLTIINDNGPTLVRPAKNTKLTEQQLQAIRTNLLAPGTRQYLQQQLERVARFIVEKNIEITSFIDVELAVTKLKTIDEQVLFLQNYQKNINATAKKLCSSLAEFKIYKPLTEDDVAKKLNSKIADIIAEGIVASFVENSLKNNNAKKNHQQDMEIFRKFEQTRAQNITTFTAMAQQYQTNNQNLQAEITDSVEAHIKKTLKNKITEFITENLVEGLENQKSLEKRNIVYKEFLQKFSKKIQETIELAGIVKVDTTTIDEYAKTELVNAIENIIDAFVAEAFDKPEDFAKCDQAQKIAKLKELNKKIKAKVLELTPIGIAAGLSVVEIENKITQSAKTILQNSIEENRETILNNIYNEILDATKNKFTTTDTQDMSLKNKISFLNQIEKNPVANMVEDASLAELVNQNNDRTALSHFETEIRNKLTAPIIKEILSNIKPIQDFIRQPETYPISELVQKINEIYIDLMDKEQYIAQLTTNKTLVNKYVGTYLGLSFNTLGIDQIIQSIYINYASDPEAAQDLIDLLKRFSPYAPDVDAYIIDIQEIIKKHVTQSRKGATTQDEDVQAENVMVQPIVQSNDDPQFEIHNDTGNQIIPNSDLNADVQTQRFYDSTGNLYIGEGAGVGAIINNNDGTFTMMDHDYRQTSPASTTTSTANNSPANNVIPQNETINEESKSILELEHANKMKALDKMVKNLAWIEKIAAAAKSSTKHATVTAALEKNLTEFNKHSKEFTQHNTGSAIIAAWKTQLKEMRAKQESNQTQILELQQQLQQIQQQQRELQQQTQDQSQSFTVQSTALTSQVQQQTTALTAARLASKEKIAAAAAEVERLTTELQQKVAAVVIDEPTKTANAIANQNFDLKTKALYARYLWSIPKMLVGLVLACISIPISWIPPIRNSYKKYWAEARSNGKGIFAAAAHVLERMGTLGYRYEHTALATAVAYNNAITPVAAEPASTSAVTPSQQQAQTQHQREKADLSLSALKESEALAIKQLEDELKQTQTQAQKMQVAAQQAQANTQKTQQELQQQVQQITSKIELIEAENKQLDKDDSRLNEQIGVEAMRIETQNQEFDELKRQHSSFAKTINTKLTTDATQAATTANTASGSNTNTSSRETRHLYKQRRHPTSSGNKMPSGQSIVQTTTFTDASIVVTNNNATTASASTTTGDKPKTKKRWARKPNDKK